MADRFRLSTEEAYILSDKMQETSDKRLSRRLLAISLRHFGYRIKEIALLTSSTERSVNNWLKTFKEEGFDGLLTLNYPKQRPSILDPHCKALKSFISKNPDARIEDIQEFLAEERGVEIEYSWLYRFLRRRKLR